MSTVKYAIGFDGKSIETTVTREAPAVTQWLTGIISANSGKPNVVVGLDVEWKPQHVSGVSSKAAIVQLCLDTKCLIIQLLHMNEGVAQSLKDFLVNPGFTFAGVGIEADVTKLKNDYGLAGNVKTADVGELAVKKWSGLGNKPGLQELASRIVGLNVTKPNDVTVSNWEANTLTKEQVEYATIDAYASFKLGHKLLLEN
uniref:3'-5' exonuclease domain-containing protein n=1 Tax=Kalanchoe fedtschenkoi TaxID=63787 RepID=A0A7N1A074_KALFE